MDTSLINSLIDEKVFGVWFLIGAALVFWMQAGFAMVECGFARAKNAGNIIMKNLMDFCIGTVVFIAIGFGLFLGEDMLLGFMGKPNIDIFTNYATFDWANFVFNLVFCATTATIVSGAMAERTRFLSYCVYSAVISAVIYPIEAHWTWGGGWLAQLGFHDFAGSNCIPRSQHSHGCPRCIYSLARLVRIQRCRMHRYGSARFCIRNDNNRSCNRYSCLHDLYMDQVW